MDNPETLATLPGHTRHMTNKTQHRKLKRCVIYMAHKKTRVNPGAHEG